MVVESSFGDFAAGGEQRGDLGFAEFRRAGLLEFSQIAVGDEARVFDESERVQERSGEGRARDGEVFDGTLRLSSVVCLSRDLDFAHGIPFGPKVAHPDRPPAPGGALGEK